MIQVLLVDDEESSLQGMKNLIPWEQWNCEIAGVADSGKKALEIIDTCPIDVVFTDIKMPEMDGLELLKETKRFHKDINFVIISGYNEFDYARTAMQYGVKNYLLKPVGIAEIEETLLSLKEIIKPDGGPSGRVELDIDKYVEDTLVAVTQKNWGRISEILLNFFKEISTQGGELEQSRILAVKFLSLLIKKEIIFSSETTLLLAGEIGSANSQSVIYGILKDQIMLTQNQSSGSISKKLNPHIRKILIYLLTHYKDKKLTLKWLSENVAYVKPDYLGKLFLHETGKNFATYLAEFRINRAKEYLKNDPKIQIYDLAKLTGYHDNVSYFIQQFKKNTGMTPAEFASSSVVNS